MNKMENIIFNRAVNTEFVLDFPNVNFEIENLSDDIEKFDSKNSSFEKRRLIAESIHKINKLLFYVITSGTLLFGKGENIQNTSDIFTKWGLAFKNIETLARKKDLIIKGGEKSKDNSVYYMTPPNDFPADVF